MVNTLKGYEYLSVPRASGGTGHPRARVLSSILTSLWVTTSVARFRMDSRGREQTALDEWVEIGGGLVQHEQGVLP